MSSVLAVPLLISAASTLAVEPTYVGKWAEMADKTCSEQLFIHESGEIKARNAAAYKAHVTR